VTATNDLVVDADGHVVEPRSAWTTVPEPYRPTVTRDPNGYEDVVVDGVEILAVPLGTLATSRFSDPQSFLPIEPGPRPRPRPT
jgi:hypothetical protein